MTDDEIEALATQAGIEQVQRPREGVYASVVVGTEELRKFAELVCEPLRTEIVSLQLLVRADSFVFRHHPYSTLEIDDVLREVEKEIAMLKADARELFEYAEGELSEHTDDRANELRALYSPRIRTVALSGGRE